MAKQIDKTEVFSLSEEEKEKKKLSHRYYYLNEMINFKNEYGIENIDAVYLFRFLCLLDNFCSYKKTSEKDYIEFLRNENLYCKIKEKLSDDKEFRESTIKAIGICIGLCQDQYKNKNLERLYYIDDFFSDLFVFTGENYECIGHLYNFYSPSLFLEESPIYDKEIKPAIDKIESDISLSYAEKLIKKQKYISEYIGKVADSKKNITEKTDYSSKVKGYHLAKQLIEKSKRGDL